MKDETSLYGVPPERVDRLLRYGLTPPEGDGETAAAPAFDRFGEQPGGRIDRYQLLRVLGEGGMGIVYLAQQDEPVKRQVALKVIKPGMDSKRVLARFEAEKQALALMDHPHIARVIDAGLTLSARPYFVMEHVKGIPITEHCDTHKLTVEERLHLFLHVCEAVQHAHQKGIIHRDLKPSNILVSIDDDKAVPKIIDFGVARAIGQQLTEKTLYTEQGQLIGTPEYMSPEQADLNNQDIDTRTDIYSLGAMLYELLAGVPPYDPRTFQDAGIEHIRKVICEEEPKTPSTKLSKTSVEKLSGSARRRGTNAGALQRRLQGDLDWITLKAMEKDRTRRYASAGELATDIRRHLSQEPVLASPPSTIYRLNKFVRRHKGLVASTLIVLAVSLIGTVVSILFARGQARARAEAQAVSNFLQRNVIESFDPYRSGGREMTIRSAFDAASVSLEGKFTDMPLAEASIRRTLGGAYWGLGLFNQAEVHIKRAVDIHQAQLGPKHPSTLASRNYLGWVYYCQNRYDEAVTQFNIVLQGAQSVSREVHGARLFSMLGLGFVYNMKGRFRQAEEILGKALETACRVLGGEHPYVPVMMINLSWTYLLQGRYAEAEQLLERGLTISRRVRGERDWETLWAMHRLGEVMWRQGRYADAEEILTPVLDARRKVLGEEHSHTLLIMYSLGRLYDSQGRYREAEELLLTTLEPARRVLGDAHITTALCVQGLGTVYLSEGRYDEAKPLLQEALEIECHLLGEESWYVLTVKNTLATLYTAQGRYDEAEQLFIKTLEISQRVLGDDHPETLTAMNGLGVLRTKKKQYGQAEPLLIEALEGRRLRLGGTHAYTKESIKNLIELYDAWNKPEQANEWRAKLPRLAQQNSP